VPGSTPWLVAIGLSNVSPPSSERHKKGPLGSTVHLTMCVRVTKCAQTVGHPTILKSRVKTPVGTVLPRLEQWPYPQLSSITRAVQHEAVGLKGDGY
jgi:hypothetical protein